MLGVAVSGVMFAIILSEPADLPTFSFGIESLPFLLLEENSRMLSLTGLAMLMSAGIIVIVNMWQELASMKDMHESFRLRSPLSNIHLCSSVNIRITESM